MPGSQRTRVKAEGKALPMPLLSIGPGLCRSIDCNLKLYPASLCLKRKIFIILRRNFCKGPFYVRNFYARALNGYRFIGVIVIPVAGSLINDMSFSQRRYCRKRPERINTKMCFFPGNIFNIPVTLNRPALTYADSLANCI
jgi:hypothetical protein